MHNVQQKDNVCVETTVDVDTLVIDGHQDEESDSEEDLAEGRARLRRILRLMVRLEIPNIRPNTTEDFTPEARAARTARIQQLQVQLPAFEACLAACGSFPPSAP